MNAQKNSRGLRYVDGGVDISAGDALVSKISRLAVGSRDDCVLGGVGGFAALYELPISRYKKPVLVSATDGVGTKLKLASALAKHDSVGVDLVAMCVNDIVVCGAKPLFFLDYFATGALDVGQAEAVIGGIARGCEVAGCALVGGESAEMPGMYSRGDYDLAGFAVGVADKDSLITPARVGVGDVVLGLASSGVHSNGFSLVRKIIARENADLAAHLGGDFGDASLGEILLTPTRIYVRALLRLFAEVSVSAVAHITGGGLPENPPRVLPPGVVAEIHRDRWTMPAIFDWLQRAGDVEDAEMLRTFNCGIGMVVVVREADTTRATEILRDAGETVFSLGEIRAGDDKNAPAKVKFV